MFEMLVMALVKIHEQFYHLTMHSTSETVYKNFNRPLGFVNFSNLKIWSYFRIYRQPDTYFLRPLFWDISSDDLNLSWWITRSLWWCRSCWTAKWWHDGCPCIVRGKVKLSKNSCKSNVIVSFRFFVRQNVIASDWSKSHAAGIS